MKHPAALFAALLLASGATLATAPAASAAAPCPSGHFCAWTGVNYTGDSSRWTTDDSWWIGSISDQDSSWANHGLPGAAENHVQVYEDANMEGDMTICLAPGQEVHHHATANDRGDSHLWDKDCVKDS